MRKDAVFDRLPTRHKFLGAAFAVQRERVMHLVKRALAASSSAVLTTAALVLFLSATAGTVLAHSRGLHPNPEIDPGSIGSAITLFVAGALYLTSRRQAK
jgi:hypothetical protein